MRTINNDRVEAADMLVTDFWTQRYLPFVTANMKASTVSGYKQIWNQHLEDHFAGMTLQELPLGRANSRCTAVPLWASKFAIARGDQGTTGNLLVGKIANGGEWTNPLDDSC
jgi:hypothetical protein